MCTNIFHYLLDGKSHSRGLYCNINISVYTDILQYLLDGKSHFRGLYCNINISVYTDILHYLLDGKSHSSIFKDQIRLGKKTTNNCCFILFFKT